ncbi:MAG: ATP-binding protein [Verrucomicrobia bacterium]|nr:ATP-binding protein [Verrucomicrobiota bacterium]
MDVFGREKEIRVLEGLYQSEEAEFLAVYGRRRIGKTFLIHEFFKDKGF